MVNSLDSCSKNISSNLIPVFYEKVFICKKKKKNQIYRFYLKQKVKLNKSFLLNLKKEELGIYTILYRWLLLYYF